MFMDYQFKYQIAIAVLAVVMGIFAGFLTVTFDLSFLKVYFLPIMAILAVVCSALIAVAYKRGRIRNF